MMDDVIYRQDAGKILCNWCGVCPEDKRDIMNCDDICPEFAKIPSAQPEIIYCKDCKHYKVCEYIGILACHYVIGGTVVKNPNDFCSRAERRTDE